jgi:hypothetical protein
MSPQTAYLLHQRQIAWVVSLLITAQLLTGNALAAVPAGGPASEAENQAIFESYCGKGIPALSAQAPRVDYQNAEIQRAVTQLNLIQENSYWFYGPVIRAYGLRKLTPECKETPQKFACYVESPLDAAVVPTPAAHALLTQLCGEFRDRATMIREKVRWYGRITKTPKNPVQPPIAPTEANVWPHLTSRGYLDFLTFSSTLWEAKRQALVAEDKHHYPELKIDTGVSAGETVDAPVDPQTVCETRYVLSSFISNPALQKKNENNETLLSVWMSQLATPAVYATYLNGGDAGGVPVMGLKNFAAKYCATPDAKGLTDAEYYFDYRGDKNFKHNSPEGNGMIWTATSVASHCANPAEDKDDKLAAQGYSCAKYFSAPFYWRWNTARAGLTAWIFRDSKYDAVAEVPTQKFTTLQHLRGDKEPLSFRVPGFEDALLFSGFTQNKDAFYSLADLGFNFITGVKNAPGFEVPWDRKLAYKRLRDAVNRHTNWYQSAFEDGMGWTMSQVYSPFVASSHVISASDGFAWGDGGRQWMFIHRVPVKNVYSTRSVMERVPVNFDTMWFDETALGTEAGVYAKSERALDRLGTALEGEFDSILYLPEVTYDDEDVPVEGGEHE